MGTCNGFIRRVGMMLGSIILLLVVVPAAQAQTPSQDIQSAGPLTNIWLGNELSCQVGHTQDASGEFFPGGSGVADCGTFLQVNVDGTTALFGPDFASHPDGSAATGSVADTPWTPVSQPGVTGAGTAASPYQVTTIVSANDSGVTLTVNEVDTYVVGNDYYESDITVTPAGGGFSGELFHAADCFLRGFDSGYGSFVSSGSTSTPACTINPNNSPPSALESFVPLTGGNFGEETSYPKIWSDIGQSNFTNGCDCTTNEDNAEGIDWPVSLSAGQSATFKLQTKIDDPGISATGGQTFSGAAPATVGGTVATIADSDTATSPSDYTATVDWGDGSAPDQNATITGANGSFTVADSHTYTSPGSYTITVTVSYTNNPANSATAHDAANITSVPRSVTTGRPSVLSSTSSAFTGSVNPDGLTTTAFFQYGLDPKYSGSGGPVVYTSTTPAQVVGSDFSTHFVSARVSGLVPNALYHVRLVATNSAGTVVGPDVTLMTRKDPPPAPPVLGKSVDVTPVAGLVLIKLPGNYHLAAADVGAHSSALTKGVGFVPLTEARQLPSGTQIDARLGSIRLVAATGKKHRTQSGTFTGGLFGFAQDRRGVNKGLTTLSLLEGAFPGAPSYASCKAKKAADPSSPNASVASLSSAVLQALHARAHGRFRTRGRYSAATVRGTAWGIRDRCDGTLIIARRHTVVVTDFVRHITVLLHQGHSYLARAPRSRRR